MGQVASCCDNASFFAAMFSFAASADLQAAIVQSARDHTRSICFKLTASQGALNAKTGDPATQRGLTASKGSGYGLRVKADMNRRAERAHDCALARSVSVNKRLWNR